MQVDTKNSFINKYKMHFKTSALINKIVACSVYFAWYFAAALSLYLGYIPLGHTTLTFLPAILVVSLIHLGFLGAFVSGLGFGLSSLMAAFIYGMLKYQYIDISVLPRFLMALIVYLIYKLLRTDKNPLLWKCIILALFAVVLNTVLTLSFQYFHHNFIGELKGILPIREWIITHPLNLIGEPIICVIMTVLLFPLMLHLRNSYMSLQLIKW